MDESVDKKHHGIFAVGGILGRGCAIFELERRWEKLRTRPDIDIAYFKASECERGIGEFSKFVVDPENPTTEEKATLTRISKEFLTSIVKPPFDKNFLTLGGVGVVLSDFYDVIKDDHAREVLGNDPYRLAYDLAMIQCAWAMKQLASGDRVSFVCDEHEQYGPLAHAAFQNLKDANPSASEYMATYSRADDKTCVALQTADAVVYEIRRALNLSLKHWDGELRDQFEIITEDGGMFLISHTSKEQLLYIASTHEPGHPFRLDILMEAEPPSESILLKL